MPLTHPNMTLVDVQAEARLTAKQHNDNLIMTGKIDIELPVRNRNYSLHWLALWTNNDKEDAMTELANLDLTLIQHRLLLLVLGKVTPGNRIFVKQHLIANHLNVAKSTISKAFKALVDRKVLLQDDLPGYKLNPKLGWYGSPHEGSKELKNAPLIQTNYKGRVKPELKLVAAG